MPHSTLAKRRAWGLKYRRKNAKAIRARHRAWYLKNRETNDAKYQAYRDANKEHIAVVNKAYREENAEKIRASKRRWYRLNKVRVRAKHRAYRLANLEKYRATQRRGQGLPEPTRPVPKLCEACGRVPRSIKGMNLDHDHKTGKFRGWLCSHCNRGLGLSGDTRESLVRMIAYLDRSS